MVGSHKFVFLNRESDLLSADDWNAESLPKLWLYNLHYFDDLVAADAECRSKWHTDLITRWIDDNPPGYGNGWEPYPTSLRIVNWIKWTMARQRFDARALTSLAVQVRWLSARIEWHLMGNHLLVNAKALVFAGLFFDGPEARRWLTTGLHLLDRQLAEQILADGGHFERSPMYHALVVEDILDLVNLSSAYDDPLTTAASHRWSAIVSRMLEWSETMTHPDGDIAFFNDAAFGIAPRFAELADYAKRLGVTSSSAADQTELLGETGYIRIERGPAVAFLDVAPVGPDYQPGHAHADTLSFELSLFGSRVLVNGGTSSYEVGEERSRQRGTAAHNTVVVDGLDSSEMWGSFRVARRARPFDLSIVQGGGAIDVTCSHDGYRRLPGAVVHRRRWRLAADGLEIDDALTGHYAKAKAIFLLHPSVRVLMCDTSRARLDASGRAIAVSAEGGTLCAVSSTWHPEFGRSLPTTRLEVDFDQDDLRTSFDFGRV
jgi:uncharacterized heparinase superfamily protein